MYLSLLLFWSGAPHLAMNLILEQSSQVKLCCGTISLAILAIYFNIIRRGTVISEFTTASCSTWLLSNTCLEETAWISLHYTQGCPSRTDPYQSLQQLPVYYITVPCSFKEQPNLFMPQEKMLDHSVSYRNAQSKRTTNQHSISSSYSRCL